MSAVAALLTAASGAALLASGYLFGAKRGAAARAALLADVTSRDERLRELEAALASSAAAGDAVRAATEAAAQAFARVSRSDGAGGAKVDLGDLRQELRSLMQVIDERERQGDALKQEIRTSLASLGRQGVDPDRVQRELQKTLTPLLRREEESRGLQHMMREVLAPLVERDRLGRELATLQGGGSLGELPRMLDAIAEKGGFSSVILSDDGGLPLAASAGAVDVDAHAATGSLLQTLIDRAERSGAARPRAVVVEDASSQLVLHRFFVVDGLRFTLSAVSRGMYLAPGALDPALASLEGALTKRQVA